MRLVAILVMLGAGVLAAIQPVVNGEMGKHVGALGALTVSVALTMLLSVIVLVAAGETGALTAGFGELKPWHALGGIAGVVIVGGSLFAVKYVGAAGVTALLLSTQLVASVLVDRYGWFGIDRSPVTATKLAGSVLLLAGAALVLRD